jgi:acyl-CoA hydrolase
MIKCPFSSSILGMLMIPAYLSSLKNFVAINTAVSVDLTVQVGAGRGALDRRGIGDLLDFAVGGTYGGKSIIAIESASSRGHSRILPSLNVVRLTSNLVTHVATEYEVARLAGKIRPQRRRLLIEVANSNHLESLDASL